METECPSCEGSLTGVLDDKVFLCEGCGLILTESEL